MPDHNLNTWAKIESERRKLAKITPSQEIQNPALYLEAEVIRMNLVTLFAVLRNLKMIK